jgi:hypothetical protein
MLITGHLVRNPKHDAHPDYSRNGFSPANLYHVSQPRRAVWRVDYLIQESAHVTGCHAIADALASHPNLRLQEWSYEFETI